MDYVIKTRFALSANSSAETRVEFTNSKRLMLISTHRFSRRVASGAQAMIRENSGESYVLFQDWSRDISVTRPPRVTAKIIDEQHKAAIVSIPELVAAMKAHYGASF